jgi:5-methylcytosine-specific restriction endonuclease McrA
LPALQASWNLVYNKLKHIAQVRNIPWALDRDWVKQHAALPCHYCGAEPSQVRHGVAREHEAVRFNGLDRVDSSGGYTSDNVVPCCKACNFAKNTMTVGEFADWVRRIYEFWASRV